MQKFWSEWPLWEKMTLVLAIAIVCAFLIGLCKNFHSRWKLRSYITVGLTSGETTPSMMEAQRTYDDEIPFGVRAIESGTEVVGIWISRGNTPVPSAYGSPASSTLASVSSMDDERIPQLSLAIHDLAFHLDEPQPTHSSARSTGSGPKQIRPKDRSSMSVATYAQAKQPHSSSRLRPASLPAPSNLRHSLTMGLSEDTDFANQNIRRVSIISSSSEKVYHRPDPSDLESGRESSSSDSSASSQLSYQFLPHLEETTEEDDTSTGKENNQPVDARADLGLLQSHRLSHVAETGQLTPRIRRSRVASSEWPAPATSRRSTMGLTLEVPTDSYFTQPTRVNPTQSVDEIEPTEPRTSIVYPMIVGDEVATAKEMEQVLSNGSKYPSFSFESLELSDPEKLTQQSLIVPEPTYSAQNTQNKRQSQVIRKVNSSFEILPPGTFTSKTSSDSDGLEEGGTDGNHRNLRKLKKQQPLDANCRRSSFVGAVQGR